MQLEKTARSTHVEGARADVSRWLPVALASALFMDLLDTSALGTALPTLAREFGTDPLNLKFALTAYMLTMAVLVPTSGWLADRWGPRRVFMNAVRVYLLGSIICGLSQSVTMIVVGRVIQGMGGAMMTPVARLIVVATTPRERLIQALNGFTIPAIIGPLMGPPLAGLLLSVASWRWIFFINLPVGLIGMWAVMRLVPRLRHPHPGPFDVSGFAIAAVAITSFVSLAELVTSQSVSWKVSIALAIIAAVSSALFVRHARRTQRPMLELRLFAKPTYLACMVGTTALRLGFGATPLLMPMLMQIAFGWSALRSGSMLVAMMAGSIVARFAATRFVRQFGFRPTLIATGIGASALSVTPVFFRADTATVWIVVALAVLGFARAAHFVAASPMTFAEVAPEEVSRASTLSTVIQQLGLSMGISIAGLALAWARPADGVLTTSSFAPAFLALAAGALLTIPAYARLHPQVGEHMRGTA